MASIAAAWRAAASPLKQSVTRSSLAVDGIAAVTSFLISGAVMMLVSPHSPVGNMRWAGAANGLSCLLLLGAHRWPRTTVWSTAAVSAYILAVLPSAPSPSAPTVAALFLLASRTDRSTTVRCSFAVGMALTVEAFAVRPELSALGSNLAVLAWTQLPSAIGDAMRSRSELLESYRERAERAEATREAEARRRVADERTRIASELHDVVAHHLTLVNAQAGVAHHLMQQNPERAHEALGQIRDTSRAALDELRAIVGLLHQPDESRKDESRSPAPGLDDLPALLESFRHAGLPVEVDRAGSCDAVPPLAELTAYRVVQEALTNAGKHGGTRARLTIAVRPGSLEVTVVDGGGPPSTGPGTGLGLISLRERVRAAGGTLQAGPRPEGGFRVHAVVPISASGRAALSAQERL